AIVLELVTTRDVACRVDLRDAREPRPHAGTLDIPGDRLHVHVASATAGFYFTRAQRTRPDKAHVAAQNVEQLRELIHGGCSKHAPDTRHTRIVLGRLERADAGLGVRNHRPELQRAEQAAAFADPFLAV